MALTSVAVPCAVVAPHAPDSLRQWLEPFNTVHVDLGTGDGAYALRVARKHPDWGVIGIDTNQDGLRGSRRRHPPNVRFERLDALAWPSGSLPVADVVTVNFPYGSLLRGLVESDPGFLERLDFLLGPAGRLEIRVNASAFAATGLDPATGPERIVDTLRRVPGLAITCRPLEQAELRSFPSSWAKRLGFGREAFAIRIEATRHCR